MCLQCWEDYFGSPKIDNPRVREAVEAIEDLYEAHFSGGLLHCQVDDWNLEDEHFENEPEGMDDEELHCWRTLKALPVAERASALYFHDTGT